MSDETPVLSGRLAVLRSGLHLAQIAQGLRDLEADMIAVDLSGSATTRQKRWERRSRLQALDLMIQELTGLSDILVGVASHLSESPDQTIDALVDMPRLQSLSRALRDHDCTAPSSEVVIF
ncbi:hypothetical protein J2X53_001744 [Pseudorhodobacter sp. 4114]|nr:hypothetical protein [Pseudorhodobacter sp. 4114]